MRRELFSIIAICCSLTAWCDNITFADANVKSLCVANWDTNGDGELSMEEASAVTTIGTVFQNNSTIEDFREFRYFTNVTSIGQYALSGCTNLSKIEFPSSLKTIDRYALYNSGFESIEFPNGVTSIGNSAIRNCTKLTSVKFGNGTVTFGKNVFRGCTQLNTITFDGTECHFNAEDPFRDCSALTSVVITDLSAWCRSTFIYASTNPLSFSHSLSLNVSENISEITNLVIPSDITAINKYAFYGCNSIESVAIGNDVSSIGNDAFTSSNLTTVTIFNKTPVEIGSSTFFNRTNATLYVHGGSKTAYEAATYWKDFSNIVELKNGDTFIAKTEEGVDVTYEIINEETMICQVGYTYNKKQGVRHAINTSVVGAVTIPSVVNGYSVRYVASYAFGECSQLTSIYIPDGVTSFGSSAFSGCANAVTIRIPNSVSSGFGQGSFAGCNSISSINIPEGITSIGIMAFYNCKSLTSVTLPSTVTKIYEQAFSGCSALNTVNLSENLELIGTSAFNNCKFSSLTLPSSFTTSYGVNYISYSGTQIGTISSLKKVVISKGVSSLYEVFRYCQNIETVICYNETPVNATNCWQTYSSPVLYVPEGSKEAYMADGNWNKLTIVEMKPLSFADSNVKNICIGIWDADGDGELNQLEVSDITALGTAFENKTNISSFNELKYFTSLTTIGENTFSNCSSLNSVAIPHSVKSIASNAFAGCNNLTSVTVESIIPCTLFSNSFPNRANATLYVPAGCKDAYSSADFWREFKAIIEIDASSMNITFADAAVKALCVSNVDWDTNGDGEISMAEAATITDLGTVFSNKLIKSFNELQYFVGLSEISENAFYSCKALESIILPQSITAINTNAFYDCKSLMAANIPNHVSTIGNLAFSNCSNLTSLLIPSSVTSIGVSAFGSCSGLNSIVVEDGNNNYDSRENCNALIETATNAILRGSKNTIIPNSITSIGASAFSNIQELTTIDIPQSVTSIGNYAFYGCKDLTTIKLPNGITNIGDNLFQNCSSLTSCVIPNSVTTIGQYAFWGCSNLTSIIIPKSVTTIGAYSFSECGNLKSISLPEGVISVQYSAFERCNALESVSLPSSINTIGQSAFSGCSKITSVTIKRKKPLYIDSYATFQYRSNATLYVPYGCKEAYETASYWTDFKEIVEMPMLGDVNNDGEVDAQDASLVLQYVAKKIDSIEIENADVNNDGNVDAQDASLILQYVAKKITW